MERLTTTPCHSGSGSEAGTTPRERDERGDVPGWVLVTVMTAGLVMVIWGVAEDQLRSMLVRRAQQGAVVPGGRRRQRPARLGRRRLRARAGRAHPAVPRHPAGRAGAVRAQHPRLGRVGGRAARGDAPTAGPADGVALTRRQIDGAVSGRFAQDIDGPARRWSTARPGIEVTVHASGARRSGIGGPAVDARGDRPRGRGAAAVRRRAGRGRQRAGRADLARHPAAGPDAVDRAVSVFEVQRGAFGVSGAARAAGRAYALAPNDADRAGPRRGRRPAGTRRPGVCPTRRSTCGSPARRTPPTATAAPRSITVRVVSPRRPAAAAGRARRRRAELRAGRHRTRCRSGSTRRSRDARRDGRGAERGQATVLIVGLATVLAMTVALVVDASAAYLQRQGLDTLADGAALRGADLGATGVDVYAGGVPEERLDAHRRPGPRRGGRLPPRRRRVRQLPGPVVLGRASTAAPTACRSGSPHRWTCR